jgi:hypothetical protein
LLLYYVTLLTINAYGMFAENVKYNATAQTTLATPLWIPQFFWISGLGFFLLSLAFLTVYGFVALAKRDWATISKIAGVKSVEEEISEETHV